MRSIKKIISDAGGPKKIAQASEDTQWPIVAKSVYDWPQIGIHWRHWPILMKLARATANELLEANKRANVATTRQKKEPVAA